MAEFQEVMREKARMCKEYKSDCNNCPLALRNSDLGVGCSNAIIKKPTEAEKIIMNWVKEHPVQTNADKFEEVFGLKINIDEGCGFLECNGRCNDCRYEKGFWEQEYKEPKGE